MSRQQDGSAFRRGPISGGIVCLLVGSLLLAGPVFGQANPREARARLDSLATDIQALQGKLVGPFSLGGLVPTPAWEQYVVESSDSTAKRLFAWAPHVSGRQGLARLLS